MLTLIEVAALVIVIAIGFTVIGRGDADMSRLVVFESGSERGIFLAVTVATATSETIPLTAVRGVMVTHVVPDPSRYVPGTLGREVTLTLGWGTVSRIDLGPASCGDPTCDADHGYDGTITGDDISLRVSADADGEPIVAAALAFAHALSAVTGLPVAR